MDGMITSGRELFASRNGMGGRWATEQMVKALKAGEAFSTSHLRTNDILRKDEWKAYDEELVREGLIRLKAVGDLIGAGLVKRLTNGFGKTVLEWETVTDMDPAELSMDGIARTDNDRQEFEISGLPLPILHKDFFLHMRTLAASRERGEALDTMQAGTAGRVVGELAEKLLFQGTTKKFRGLSIYGLTTHPNRNIGGFIANGNWAQSAKTGADIVNDVLKMKEGLQADRFYGPYWIYVGADADTKLDQDYSSVKGEGTIRERVMKINGVQKLEVVDSLPAGNVVMFQPTRDVVQIVEGAPLQTIQWEVEGGMRINFKAMAILIPNIRADADGRSGVYHMS